MLSPFIQGMPSNRLNTNCIQKLTAFINSWVQTDMGNAGAVAHGLEEAPTTVVDSINGMVEKVSLPFDIPNGEVLG